ncbi:hypothetical protein ACSX1A_15975 [Pontibacter sp. MBLB2868]|uniref:hypothetical protein n=1 Tax=Pontibacter sp. MBLB2868 TaxID=3451555 RepID=UPI003F74DAE8
MNKTFTPKFSDYTLLAFMFFAFALGSCSTHVEQEVKSTASEPEAVAAEQTTSVTVAAIEKSSDEVYFDLIAKTTNCLGEDLWLGGKLESTDKVTFSNSGAISKTKAYKVTELTATGLNTNNSYLVNNNAGTLWAKYDEKGVIYLQLSEGKMQLKAYPSATPVVVAYQPNPQDGERPDGTLGRWSCQ